MAISLNNHESRINSINTNISSLGTRIANLEKAPPSKDWAVVTLTGSQTTQWAIPSTYLNGYNFYVVGWSGFKMSSYYEQEYSNNRMNHYVTKDGKYRFIYRFERNGNYIRTVLEQSANPTINNIIVMFYK